MISVWKDNAILKKWVKKRSYDFFDGNFNYDLNNLITDPLLDAISNNIGVDKEFIYTGAGISQLICVLLSMDCWERIYLPNIEFGLYLRQSELLEKEIIRIPSYSIEQFLENLKKYNSSDNDLLCISTPRWFDGSVLSLEQLNEILNFFKGTIVIDEAYLGYSYLETGFLNQCLNNDRIIILRSFSKMYFSSGLRVGYLVTKKEIKGLRNTLIPPHSISTFSANFAISLLNDKKTLDLFANTRKYIMTNRDILSENIEKLSNVTITKSYANFISLKFNSKVVFDAVYEALKGLPGIQKFEINGAMFIKIWISDSSFSNVVFKRINEALSR